VKAHARFSIGIDLGTTNSALAFAPLLGEGTPEILFVPQWESLASLTEEPTLPSFLYLPEEAAAAYFRGKDVGAEEWVVGRFARIKASETLGASSIPRSPGFAITPPTGRSRFCLGDRQI
jgi:molecular chaperone DnaK (HSP70)